MKILTLTQVPDASIAAALDRFERQFQYPLGTHDTFRISHGEDYSRFFRAMGKGVSFVAEDDGKILGTLGMSVRKMRQPDGSAVTASYVGDLKVSPAVQGLGVVPLALFQAALRWAWQRGATKAYGVVMDGTAKTPTSYTGRLGIPAFLEVGKIAVLRIPTDGIVCTQRLSEYHATAARLQRVYKKLAQPACAPVGGYPTLRSQHVPLPLVSPDGAACGLLEDTIKAKRLIASNGEEMRSAHLSRFVFSKFDHYSAMDLLSVALHEARARGFPAMFVAVDAETATELQPLLLPLGAAESPATVFGYGFLAGQKLVINTAEI